MCSKMSEQYYSKPWQVRLANQVSDALRERKDWLAVNWYDPAEPKTDRQVRLLDYACGRGAITKALGPWVTTIRGVDVSDGMVEKYNETARESGMSEAQAYAVVGDLIGEQVPEYLLGEEFKNFDVAAIGLGFHHFDDPLRCLQRLKERLIVGGQLIIIDFLPFNKGQFGHGHGHGHSHEHKQVDMGHTIKHSGFTKEEMERLYKEAGLVDFGMDILEEPAIMELDSGTQERTIFIAKGKRAS
jgi:SAM-dependent methyltransferase